MLRKLSQFQFLLQKDGCSEFEAVRDKGTPFFLIAIPNEDKMAESQIKIINEIFKSNENIQKKEGGSYYVVSTNKASSVTLQSPGYESQKKYTAVLRISNRQSIQRLI